MGLIFNVLNTTTTPPPGHKLDWVVGWVVAIGGKIGRSPRVTYMMIIVKHRTLFLTSGNYHTDHSDNPQNSIKIVLLNIN